MFQFSDRQDFESKQQLRAELARKSHNMMSVEFYAEDGLYGNQEAAQSIQAMEAFIARLDREIAAELASGGNFAAIPTDPPPVGPWG